MYRWPSSIIGETVGFFPLYSENYVISNLRSNPFFKKEKFHIIQKFQYFMFAFTQPSVINHSDMEILKITQNSVGASSDP